MVVAFSSLSWVSLQLSLATTPPDGSCNSRVGSARFSSTGRTGPRARTITFFGCEPVMIKPAISTLSPPPTARRGGEVAEWDRGEAPGVGRARAEKLAGPWGH